MNKNEYKKIQKILSGVDVLDVTINSLELSKHNHVFKIDLLGLPAENEYITEYSSFFAFSSLFREHIAKKLKIDDFKISFSYFSFWEKFERSNYLLSIIESNDNKFELTYFLNNWINDTLDWQMTLNIFKKYGFIPKQNMKETFHAFDSRKINYLLEWKIKSEISKFKKHHNKKSYKKEILFDIFKILKNFYGEINNKCDFEYILEIKKNSMMPYNYGEFNNVHKVIKSKCDMKFSDLFSEINFNNFICISNIADKELENKKIIFNHINNVVEFENSFCIELNANDFIILCLIEMLQKSPFIIYCDNSWFFNDKYGVYDNKIYEIDKLLDIEFQYDKRNLVKTKTISPNHCMSVFGVNWNHKNYSNLINKILSLNFSNNDVEKILNEIDITNWKVKNSYGECCGKYGYYSISNTWFKKFVCKAIIKKDNLISYLKKIKNIDLNFIEVVNKKSWEYF